MAALLANLSFCRSVGAPPRPVVNNNNGPMSRQTRIKIRSPPKRCALVYGPGCIDESLIQVKTPTLFNNPSSREYPTANWRGCFSDYVGARGVRGAEAGPVLDNRESSASHFVSGRGGRARAASGAEILPELFQWRSYDSNKFNGAYCVLQEVVSHFYDDFYLTFCAVRGRSGGRGRLGPCVPELLEPAH
ncbi:hypothetical protein EVAR_60496_1 [Eumeta japonica]|uniref:Uncharacterized protein n=1 Tax=Eumeta variegata TaxID=151549 RepID=A0A4C1ZJ72_EUMVA|nr:hypothetical protein EVAR_60496_1 [Eumeta japonica]